MRGNNFKEELLNFLKGSEKFVNIAALPLSNLNDLRKILKEEGLDVLYISESTTPSYDKIYDLIIYDDISYLPLRKKGEVKGLLMSLSNRCKKMMAISSEVIFPKGEIIEYPLSFTGSAVTEPRNIITHLNLKNDLPKIIFEYLNFFYIGKRNVALIFKDRETMTKLRNEIIAIGPNLREYILDSDYLEEEVLRELVSRELPAIILFPSLEEFSKLDNVLSHSMDYIVWESDKDYEARTFEYLALKNSLRKDLIRELLLVGNDESEAMKNSKDLTREYNKELWENGYFSSGIDEIL